MGEFVTATALARRKVIQRVAIMIAAILMGSLGFFSALDFTDQISWTPLLMVAWFVLWVYSNPSEQRWVCVVAIALWICFVAASNAAARMEVGAAMYLITFAAVASALWIRIAPESVVFARRVLWVAALCSAGLILFSLFVQLPWIGRSGQTVLPLAVSVLLLLRGSSRLQLGVALTAAFVVLLQLTLTTARSASVLTIASIGIWALFDRRVPRVVRGSFSVLVTLAAVTYWVLVPQSLERLVGNDASIVLGPVTINGEGRMGAQAALRDAVSSYQATWPDWASTLLGRGAGWSHGALSREGHPFDAPHNELLRFYYDLGLVGLVVLILLILTIGVLAVRMLRNQRSVEGSLLLVTSLSLTVYSLTDNALGYAWFMVPAAVIVSWSLSTRLHSIETAHNHKDLSEPVPDSQET